MNQFLRRYCSSASLLAAAQFGRLDTAAKDTYLWLIPTLCVGILFAWDLITKEKADARRKVFGTYYGYAIVCSIAFVMILLGIAVDFVK